MSRSAQISQDFCQRPPGAFFVAKVLTPNDFPNLDAIRLRLALYEE
jgi:hypothetical protein